MGVDPLTTTVAIATRACYRGTFSNHPTVLRPARIGGGGGASCRVASGGWADHGHGVVVIAHRRFTTHRHRIICTAHTWRCPP
jgi:hypothetical protein